MQVYIYIYIYIYKYINMNALKNIFMSVYFLVQLFILRYLIKVLQHPKVRKGHYTPIQRQILMLHSIFI